MVEHKPKRNYILYIYCTSLVYNFKHLIVKIILFKPETKYNWVSFKKFRHISFGIYASQLNLFGNREAFYVLFGRRRCEAKKKQEGKLKPRTVKCCYCCCWDCVRGCELLKWMILNFENIHNIYF